MLAGDVHLQPLLAAENASAVWTGGVALVHAHVAEEGGLREQRLAADVADAVDARGGAQPLPPCAWQRRQETT